MDECEDFLDTAALIEQLDLVISVDTSAAHPAGALGKPIWLLNRFGSVWQWMLDREDTRVVSDPESRCDERALRALAGYLKQLR